MRRPSLIDMLRLLVVAVSSVISFLPASFCLIFTPLPLIFFLLDVFLFSLSSLKLGILHSPGRSSVRGHNPSLIPWVVNSSQTEKQQTFAARGSSYYH